MKVSGYVQIVSKRNGRQLVMERVNKTRPRDPLPGAVIVKVTLDVPDEAFLPLEAEGAIPAEFVGRVPLEAEPLDDE